LTEQINQQINTKLASKGCQRREHQNYLWNGYQRRDKKEDVLEKCGWKEYKQPWQREI
jgi:predicted Fe-S protein YdhL (DUF1289 family)